MFMDCQCFCEVRVACDCFVLLIISRFVVYAHVRVFVSMSMCFFSLELLMSL
jgi:hypothetical protein